MVKTMLWDLRFYELRKDLPYCNKSNMLASGKDRAKIDTNESALTLWWFYYTSSNQLKPLEEPILDLL